jgi:pyruvate formate lyase activating enzyme
MDIQSVVGRIFDIQKFSTHDGTGIRTVVFLKGCILRCRWCCNPESQRFEIQEMNTANGKRIVGYDTTVGNVMQQVLQDMPYYRRSHGGMTLSGGEALCQTEFVHALLTAAKEHGIDTAVETTGCLPYNMIEPHLPLLDTILLDIKHINSEKHEEYTSMRNELILANARKMAEAGAHIIVRVPTIPTFNDTEEEIADIARFAKSLPGVKEIHLLPYHRLGYDKYIGLGRPYLMGDIIKPPSVEHMEELRRAAEREGLHAMIGG